MKFPFFPINKLSRSKDYLALFLKEEEGIVLILNHDNGKMVAREKERFHYSDGWEHIVQDIDEVLFRLEQKLNTTLDQTIFFVYSHFIDEKAADIKKPYLQKIKEIVKNLELHALGYIECSEAVLQYLEKKEEMPLTAILVELDKTNVGVFVYKGGRIAHRKILSRTDNLIDDLLKGFEDLKGKFLLPARIILYNSKDLDDESTKIVTHHWSEDYFIQLPRVEILKEDETIESLIGIFSEQITKEGKKFEENHPKGDRPLDGKEAFGFVIGEDIETKEKVTEEISEKQVPVKNPFFLGINFKELRKRIKPPKLQVPKLNISKRFSVIFGIAFILLSLILNELFFHKAAVTIFLPSESLNKKMDISTLPVFVSTSSASFTESKTATGKRDVGDSAKGTVTISNFDDREKLFAKGTVVTASELQFSLDTDVKVASASLTADGSAKLPGKNSATVTAANIGPEGNIAKGARFKIDDLSQSLYFALNENTFSGGTRKQIQTVSKKDIQDLEASIMEKAKKPQSVQTTNNSSRQDEEIITQLSKIELRDQKFSKEVGEEATNVTLQATADTSYFYLKKDELLSYLHSQLLPDVKQGFNIEKNKIHYSIDSVEKKNDTITLHVSVNAKAIKQVSKDEILKNITGKNRSSIESFLKRQYQAEGFELTIKEPFPLLNTILPFIKSNITVVISSL